MTSNAVKHECDAKTAVIQVLFTCCVGSDLLKLTRDDLVQICGPADGIRLFNALKSRCVLVFVFCFSCRFVFVKAPVEFMSPMCLCRSVRPRLTVYICQESSQESPLLERHSANENGEHSISSSLHGKQNSAT